MKKYAKRMLILGILGVVLGIIFWGSNAHKTQNFESTSAEPEEVPEKLPVEWHGNYIWDGSSENNTWLCFRKKVNIEENELKDIVAQIVVDSKYWLYINGQMVVREGALKRGQTRTSTYYDEIDVTQNLQIGENTIAILVWHWGDDSISHNSSKQGTLLFQAKIGDHYLISDETWKVSKHQAYLQDELRPNKRLVEYNVCYDATRFEESWVLPRYDDTNWENSKILGQAGAEPWGELIERNIPQFKDYGFKEYENMSEYVNYQTNKKEKFEMIIPYNAQFSPYLKIEAPAGQKITIQTDQYEDINGDSVRCTYLTKDGIQEFESLAWMNGEKVYYEIPQGVKIISLGYRETGYDAEMTGSFTCDNEFLNQLWKMATRTLYVNMRDNYMDCPNRERAAWWGDVSMEMLEAMYALDTNAYALYEKTVKTTIGWKLGPILLTVVPIENDCIFIPVQMLAAVNSMYEYYEYTGKRGFLEEVYPSMKEFIDLWKVNEATGLFDLEKEAYPPTWEWGDSVAECDYKAIENAWLYLAMSQTAKVAEILEKEEDVAELTTRLVNFKTSYNQLLWTEKGYKTPESKMVDERANSLAVISGLADESQYDVIANLLNTSYEATVYMEKYVLQALCEMGKIEEAQERIESRYHEMVKGKKVCSTLWENWIYEVGSKNHAWAGGPLIIMSKYFAGIEPLEEGYEVISIKPQFGKLNKIKSQVTTVKGEIWVEAQKSENNILMNINVPAKTRIALPKISENFEIEIDGKLMDEKKTKYKGEDEKDVYFYVEKGKKQIKMIAK